VYYTVQDSVSISERYAKQLKVLLQGQLRMVRFAGTIVKHARGQILKYSADSRSAMTFQGRLNRRMPVIQTLCIPR